MKFCKVRNVKSPSRGTPGSAGIDLYVPEDFQAVLLKPRQHINIPSGIKFNIPQGYALIAFNKSGVATKKNLIVGACVIDEDFMGEVGLHMINIGKIPILIEPGMKLLQLLLIPIVYEKMEESNIDEIFLNKISERGENGYGSTGEK